MSTRWDMFVSVAAQPDEDATDVVEVSRRLRTELAAMEVEADPIAADAAPDGAKGLATLLGLLGVEVGDLGLSAVLHKLGDWSRRNQRTIEVTLDGDTIKLSNASPEEHQRLVDAWLARHGDGPR